MKKSKLIKTVFALTVAMLIAGCNYDSKNPADMYPKTVTIQYKVSSTQSNAKADIVYTNTTGDISRVESVALPFSANFSKTVNYLEVIALVVFGEVSGVNSFSCIR